MNASEDYQESHDQKIKSYKTNDQLELEYQYKMQNQLNELKQKEMVNSQQRVNVIKNTVAK